MAEYIHRTMAAGRWFELTIAEQLGNVGSEIGRAVNAGKRGDAVQRERALERAFDLLDLTLADRRWKGPRLREIARAREVVGDTFYGDKEYGSSEEDAEHYFFQFAYLARKDR